MFYDVYEYEGLSPLDQTAAMINDILLLDGKGNNWMIHNI